MTGAASHGHDRRGRPRAGAGFGQGAAVMVDISQKERTIRVKLVYYGPALGGKTTNLRVLHERALRMRRGDFVSVNSMQDRTILCDLLPLKSGGFRGYDLRLQLLAVPGQAIYGATRRVVLRGADGVVFVGNSAADRFHENRKSLEEMTASLIAHQLDPLTLPTVFQYNKRDLPSVSEVEALERALNPRRLPAFPAVAPRGSGVLETFAAILGATIASLSRRYRTMELPPGQALDDWVAQAVDGMFGCSSFDDPEGAAAGPAEDEPVQAEEIELADGTVMSVGRGKVLVKVTTPEEAPPPAPAAASAAPVASPAPPGPAEPRVPAEALAASYAEATAELGFVVSDLREERDVARARLEEMRRALELATTPGGAADPETRLRRALEVLQRAGGATHASLRLTAADPVRVVVLPPLEADPLGRSEWGVEHLASLPELAEPIVEEASESAQLAHALQSSAPPHEAVVLVPLRSAERPLGLALLYYDLHAPLPPREGLAHLGFLARELAGPLEASAAREAADAARRLGALSRASAATVASLLTRLPEDFARRQKLDLGEVLAPVAVPGVAIDLPPGGLALLGDAPLLRFAIATLAHLCEAEQLARGEGAEVAVSGRLEDGVPCVDVRGTGGVALLVPRQGALDASEAELTVVQAVLAANGASLQPGRDEAGRLRFTVRLAASS
ncbi:MAG: GTPase domain-containing protein [Vicinamibacteria bacterium]